MGDIKYIKNLEQLQLDIFMGGIKGGDMIHSEDSTDMFGPMFGIIVADNVHRHVEGEFLRVADGKLCHNSQLEFPIYIIRGELT